MITLEYPLSLNSIDTIKEYIQDKVHELQKCFAITEKRIDIHICNYEDSSMTAEFYYDNEYSICDITVNIAKITDKTMLDRCIYHEFFHCLTSEFKVFYRTAVLCARDDMADILYESFRREFETIAMRLTDYWLRSLHPE